MRECINKFTPIFGVSNRAQITGTHTNFKYVDQSITRLLQENERMRSKNNCFLTTVGIGSQTESNLDHLVMLVQLRNSIQDNPTTFPTHGGAFIRLDVCEFILMNFNIIVTFNNNLIWIESIWISCHESNSPIHCAAWTALTRTTHLRHSGLWKCSSKGVLHSVTSKK